MANTTAELFIELGFAGRDLRQIVVTVHPYSFCENGQLVEGWKAYAGMWSGDISTGLPTDYVFATSNPDWEFASFELNGKTWPGLAMYPDDGDASVEFGDQDRRSVVLKVECQKLYTHRYQLVLRNRITGELAICDPNSGNGDGKGND